MGSVICTRSRGKSTIHDGTDRQVYDLLYTLGIDGDNSTVFISVLPLFLYIFTAF